MFDALTGAPTVGSIEYRINRVWRGWWGFHSLTVAVSRAHVGQDDDSHFLLLLVLVDVHLDVVQHV